jgi:POT family proton-dependent oligopeptide transporter
LTDPLQTLPIYTSLFNKLGMGAIACTVIALLALPLMRKLTASHQAHQ